METALGIVIIFVAAVIVGTYGLIEKAKNDVVGDYLDGEKRSSWLGPLYRIYNYYWNRVEDIH